MLVEGVCLFGRPPPLNNFSNFSGFSLRHCVTLSVCFFSSPRRREFSYQRVAQVDASIEKKRKEQAHLKQKLVAEGRYLEVMPKKKKNAFLSAAGSIGAERVGRAGCSESQTWMALATSRR